jgi:hypothetical protein
LEKALKGRPWVDDPEPEDENDPEVILESNRTFQACGTTPEDIKDAKARAAYVAFLKDPPPEDDD